MRVTKIDIQIPTKPEMSEVGAKTVSMSDLLDELKQSEWFQTRPEIIQKAIDQTPPDKLYRFKDSKKECTIIGYTESETPSGVVTLIVQKTGNGGSMAEMGMGALDTNQVFDVAPDSLEPVVKEAV